MDLLMSSETTWGIVAIIAGVVSWGVNLIQSSLSGRLDALEKKSEDVKHRVTVIETDYLKHCDLNDIIQDLHADINKSFTRLHSRIDNIYNKNGIFRDEE